MQSLTRRMALKVAAWGAALLGIGKGRRAVGEHKPAPEEESVVGHLGKTHDRVWLGGEFWANPMEDWRVVNGAAQCQTGGGDRNVHLITHQLTNSKGAFNMSVRVQRSEAGKRDAGAGFRIGVRSDINEHRSNCFAGGGIRAGIGRGELVLGSDAQKLDVPAKLDDFTLELSGKPAGEKYSLTLSAKSPEGKVLGTLQRDVQPQAILGNVAVVSNLAASPKNGQGARYAFRDWTASGDAFTISPQRKFGPILWAMYSLSDSRGDEGFVMKITALTGPLGEKDNQNVELQVKQDGAVEVARPGAARHRRLDRHLPHRQLE